MPKAMDAEAWRARSEAYREASEHLRLAWTDDKGEFEQGKIVAGKLMAESTKCLRIAASS